VLRLQKTEHESNFNQVPSCAYRHAIGAALKCTLVHFSTGITGAVAFWRRELVIEDMEAIASVCLKFILAGLGTARNGMHKGPWSGTGKHPLQNLDC
jgi:hypothetical protein